MKLSLDGGIPRDGLELAVDVVAPGAAQGVEGPRRDELIDGGRPGLHLRGLVLGSLQHQVDIGHVAGDPGDDLTDPG